MMNKFIVFTASFWRRPNFYWLQSLKINVMNEYHDANLLQLFAQLGNYQDGVFATVYFQHHSSFNPSVIFDSALPKAPIHFKCIDSSNQ